MSDSKVGKTISRLAVVTKDFATYYIPGVTKIDNKYVTCIDEQGEFFIIYDKDETVLSKISKSSPVVVDYAEVYEVWDPSWLNSDEVQQILITFGNYLFKEYGIMATDSRGREMDIRQISDADMKNFVHSLLPK